MISWAPIQQNLNLSTIQCWLFLRTSYKNTLHDRSWQCFSGSLLWMAWTTLLCPEEDSQGTHTKKKEKCDKRSTYLKYYRKTLWVAINFESGKSYRAWYLKAWVQVWTAYISMSLHFLRCIFGKEMFSDSRFSQISRNLVVLRGESSKGVFLEI